MSELLRPIEEELKLLQRELNEAEWEQDYERIHGLVMAIDRLKFLLSMGETYDLAF